MNNVTPRLRHLAERLVGYEAAGKPDLPTKLPAACLASEKLRPHVATLIGNIGFRALISRSIALGIADVPWLNAVNVNADGSFDGLEELEVQVELKEFSKGCTVLLAHLLGLLVAFIGEELVLRLVGEAWPDQSFDKLNFDEGGK